MAIHGIYHIGRLTNLPTAGLDLRLVDSVFKYAYIGYTSTYLYCAHTFDSCNMGTSDLPDMYAQSPRAAGLRAESIHIRQITSAYVIIIM